MMMTCSCADESQDIECEERDSFQEAHEKKKTCDNKRYEANRESMKESAKANYDQNRELILASKQDEYQANQKAKRGISRINSFRKEILRGRSVCNYTHKLFTCKGIFVCVLATIYM